MLVGAELDQAEVAFQIVVRGDVAGVTAESVLDFLHHL